MATAGLTTTETPLIEDAVQSGVYFVDQPYEMYSAENHATWRRLYREIEPKWQDLAVAEFLDGVERLAIKEDVIPNVDAINSVLLPRTGLVMRPAIGFLPAYRFFACLRDHCFPTTVTIRSSSSLAYLPEPDIVHDVAGHGPMHAHPEFVAIMFRFGELADQAVRHTKETCSDSQERVARLQSVLRALARCFWFTVEFGLMRENGQVKAYGGGLLSSAGELVYSTQSSEVQRFPLQLEWMINQNFEIDHYQSLLFVAESFDQLSEMVEQLGAWMVQGKLDHVAPGEPLFDQDDLAAFLGDTLGS